MIGLVALATALAGLPAQRVWRVNHAGGPNVDFLDLPPAVAAAAPGDMIWVYHTSNTGPLYSAPTIDKPLAIAGFNTLGTPGHATPSRAVIEGELRIIGIAAGSRVALSNLALIRRTLSAPHKILASDCAGSIVFEDVYFGGDGFANTEIRFARCNDVVLRGCNFRLSGSPVEFEDSQGSLSTTRVSDPGPFFGGPLYGSYTRNRESLLIRRSDVTVIGCIIDGAAHVPGWNPMQNWFSQPAAVIESGSLTLGPATILRGGTWSGVPDWAFSMPTPSLATCYVDPRSHPLQSVPPFATTPTRVDTAYHDWVVAGENYHVSVVGPPAGFGLLCVGDLSTQPLDLGFGVLALELSSVLVMGFQSLDSQGYQQWSATCPPNVPIGHAFAFQAALLARDGTISLSRPSPFTVGWPHGVFP